MSRDRFNLIWRYLHLTNNAIPAAIGDKLSKVRWYMDFLNNQFQTVYVPYGKYAVDESMIRFKGRLAFRQYMPAKPIKWGVKFGPSLKVLQVICRNSKCTLVGLPKPKGVD